MTAAIALVVALTLMLIELRVSVRHERALRQRGAVSPPDPVYPVMRWGYPGTFVVMAVEGWLSSTSGGLLTVAGATLFVAAKVLKTWAILTLGERWTFPVLVLPGIPLVSGGPYRWLRHPNYVAVVAELVAFALAVGAPVSGAGAVLFFGELLRRRIRAEEEALGIYFRKS